MTSAGGGNSSGRPPPLSSPPSEPSPLPPPPSSSDDWYVRCAEAGAVGGVGAIPGTLAAHPADVVKVRQQLSSETLLRAASSVYRGTGTGTGTGTRRCVAGGGGAAFADAARPSLRNFFSGSVPAVQQKVATRTPMFLLSSLSVSLFESNLGFDPTSAAFVGSAASGYLTGFLASPWEWQKVLVGQNVDSPARGRGLRGLVSEAVRANGGGGPGGGVKAAAFAALGGRFHAAGVRNAVFDSTFFGCKRLLEDGMGRKYPGHPYLDTGFAYGASALVAVVVDYAFDVNVKRLYAIGPEEKVVSRGKGVLRSTASIVMIQGRTVYRGLGFKCVEFFVSYVITGLLAAHVTWGVDVVARRLIRLKDGG